MKAEIKGTKLVEIPYLAQELSDSGKKVLVIGERIGNEGIVETILEKTGDILCTDIMELQPESILDGIIKETPTVRFLQGDFITFDETVKYDYIVCINVLEHFGMNFTQRPMFTDDKVCEDYVIKWNYDMKAIDKMVKLLSAAGKIIITVPCGNPVLSGDCDSLTTMPFLRRYDYLRISKIKELVTNLGCHLKESFYYSENFVDWLEAGIEISHPQNISLHNPYSPNIIWAFTITKT
jgi:hypothetical protein